MNPYINVFLLFSYLTEWFIFLYYSQHMIICNIRPQKLMLLSGIAYLVMFIVSVMDIGLINILLFIILTMLILYKFFRLSFKSAFTHTVLLTLCMSATEMLTLLILQNTTYDYYNNDFILQNRLIYAVISKLLYFLAVFIFVKIFGKKYTEQPWHHIPAVLFIVPFISMTFIITIVLIWANDYTTIINLPTALLIPSIIVLLVILNVLVYLDEFNQSKRNEALNELERLKQREADLNEYYIKLIQDDEYKASMMHDLKNHLYSILSLNENNDNEAVSQYINGLLCKPYMKSSVKRSDDHFLNAILNRYAEMCQRENISFDTDIRKCALSFLSVDELTSLLCNLLDNAFEASSKCTHAFIDLYAESLNETKFSVIRIKNTCRENPAISNLSDINTIPTTKEDRINHGYGLKSINNIVSKYNGEISFNYDPVHLIFTVTISLHQK